MTLIDVLTISIIVSFLVAFYVAILTGSELKKLRRRLTELERWTRKNGEAGE